MFYLQAPAGNNISLKTSNTVGIDAFFNPFHCLLYGNGTSSLAAAITAAVAKQGIDKPEVLIPAYACPDLISAVIYANAKPVLCDLEPNSARLDINILESHINNNTAAIIAVNLLGITENAEKLRALTKQYKLILIEDSAQYFPNIIESTSWFGDFIILSFGRGKPASILTGGAVLTKNSDYAALLPKALKSEHSTAKYRLKTHLYNFLVNPYIYNLLDKTPGIKLGETYYKHLDQLADFNTDIKPLLIHNLEQFQNITSTTINQYQSIFEDCAFIDDLYSRQKKSSDAIPLRYPILTDSKELRDKIYKTLVKNGVGASKMYQDSLNRIPSVEKFIDSSISQPNAENLSERLLTLPTHNRVKHRDIERLSKAINSI